MTSEVTYVGHVLEDGHLWLSPDVKRALRLRPGVRLDVTLARSRGHGGRARQIGWPSLEELSRGELERVAKFRFSRRVQQRMERLLVKNQEGTLTAGEKAELERLSHESLVQCARKAHASHLLSRRR